MFNFPYTLVIRPLLFGVHEGGKLMVVAACFGKREHLGGKHVHKKKRVGDDHPKNFVR